MPFSHLSATSLGSRQSLEDGPVALEVLGYAILIMTGKVYGGTIQIDEKSLPEGALITVLAQEGDETFDLSAEEETKLFAAPAGSG